MNGTPLYTYHLSGRRPGTIFALCVSMLMLGVGVQYGAPWYFLAPVGLAGLMMVWAILSNPKTGSVLTTEKLHFFNRGTEETVLVSDITSMSVRSWTDGPDTVTLRLKSGGTLAVPSLCADSKLAPALRALGVGEQRAPILN
jgi:hypothetical protein